MDGNLNFGKINILNIVDGGRDLFLLDVMCIWPTQFKIQKNRGEEEKEIEDGIKMKSSMNEE